MALVALLCHMALAHIRHADLVGLVGPLALAASLGPQLAARLRSEPVSAVTRLLERRARPAAAPAAILTLAVAVAMSLPLLLRPLERGDGPVTPASALAAAQALGLDGPVLNSERFGGYLVYQGVPTFIDGRIELYGNAFLTRFIAAAGGNAAALAALLDRYRIQWTLLAPEEGAVPVLDRLPGWRRVYSDAHAVIHTRACGGPLCRARRCSPPSASISASSGNRPSCFLENARRPSTVISNTPATPLTSSTSAPYFSTSLALARRALGS